jgi:hypothetical protein
MPPARSVVALAALLPFAAGALFACAKDAVLPDLKVEAVCGNGILEVGEECDVKSPGCVNCTLVPGWSCTKTACSEACDDGLVGDGGTCDQRDTACDMTGYWAARESDYTRDAVLGAVQTSSSWVLYHFVQTGDGFQVAESINCGTHVTGSATVDPTAGALRGELSLNRMDQAPHGPRHGTSATSDGGGCAVTLDRWYVLEGAVDSFLPADFVAAPALSTLPPLPQEADPVNGTDFPAGATDPDGDGIPGDAVAITGIASGIRNSVARYWKQYATAPGADVPAAAVTVVVPGTFDVQTSVLRVTECGSACSLIAAAANPAPDLPGHVTLRFIGKTYGSSRVSAVVAGVPGQDASADLDTCANIQLLLPHDPKTP